METISPRDLQICLRVLFEIRQKAVAAGAHAGNGHGPEKIRKTGDMISADKISITGREMAGNLERRFGRKWIYLGTGAIGLIVLLLLVRLWSPRQTPGAPPPRPVAVAKVTTKDVPLYLDEIGTCAAYETVQVQAQVRGQIIKRDFQDGADVKKGDLLFTIDPRPFQAALDAAKADTILAQANLKRQEELQARRLYRDQDYDTARANASGRKLRWTLRR